MHVFKLHSMNRMIDACRLHQILHVLYVCAATLIISFLPSDSEPNKLHVLNCNKGDEGVQCVFLLHIHEEPESKLAFQNMYALYLMHSCSPCNTVIQYALL